MLVLGHQGACRSFPPNTLAAFVGALDLGADGVELDVRRTLDGALALSHGGVLPDGRVLLETAGADLAPDVDVLADALRVLEPARMVNVEIKNLEDDTDFDPTMALADAVVEVLRRRGELEDARILVSCFHLETVDRVHELAPGLGTAWLVYDASEPAPLIERTVEHGHVAFHPHQSFVTEDLVDRAHAAGLTVNTWTCDDPERIRWLRDIGVDGLVTNEPALAVAALAS